MRPTPFDLVFRQSAEEVFPAIRTALEQAGCDPFDRDRFLMVRAVVTLLRELRPDEGLGEGIDQLAALLHHAYLFWDAGEPASELSADRLVHLLTMGAIRSEPEPPAAYYVAMPEHKMWAEVIPGHPPEPLDGCFVHSASEGEELRVLGVFGIHREREGFSVVEARGTRPEALARSDGSELFAPTLDGGKSAGVWSIIGEEELLELGWRTRELGADSWALGLAGSERPAPRSEVPWKA